MSFGWQVAVVGEGELSQEGVDTTSLQYTSIDSATVAGNGDQRLYNAETLIPSSSASLPRPSNYQAEGIVKRLKDR